MWHIWPVLPMTQIWPMTHMSFDHVTHNQCNPWRIWPLTRDVTHDSDDRGIRYVLPALWMTSRFPIMGPMVCRTDSIYVSALLEQVVINFKRIHKVAPQCLTLSLTQWQQTAYQRVSLPSAIALLNLKRFDGGAYKINFCTTLQLSLPNADKLS